ncbi:MAG TPA: MopE-related protein [bacterium]|nr:MopE-related protein [bacterium]
MRNLLILCGALLLAFIAACDSKNPTNKEDADEPLFDGDLIVGDEDGLFDDGDSVTESEPDTDGVKPEGDVSPEADMTPDDDGVQPSDDGTEMTDDGTVISDGDEEPIDEDAVAVDDGTVATDDQVVVGDDTTLVDDTVVPDSDSSVTCADDGVSCTQDVVIGGQCVHLPRHQTCPTGKLCSAQAGCVAPNDWICRSCQNGPSDCKYATDICAPFLGEDLCMLPCTTSAECPSGFVCNEIYDDQNVFLGTGCTPGNYVCCLNLDGDIAGVGAKCSLKDCDESSDDIYPGASEICNGKDDNCNGSTDEALGTAPLCTKQDGICQGSQKTCGGSSGWIDCNNAAYAAWNDKYQTTETLCDGLDNDCNGEVDEPFAAELQELCMVGVGECLRVGLTVCTAAGDDVKCSVTPGTPAAFEMCNDKDDNCKDGIDEGFDGKNTPCFNGTGACKRAGVYSCSTDGWELVCDAVAGTPTDEQCNGIDDDCKNGVDDGVAAIAPNCTKIYGVCNGIKQKCTGSQGWLDCGQTDYLVYSSGLYQEGTETLCDGYDNDCDNAVDESLANYAPACDNPVAPTTPLRGVCVGARKACGGLSGWQTCGAAQFGASYQASENLCDYLDNDCDGVVDEGFLNAGTGKYDQNIACGNCQTNCITIYGKPNSYGTCNATGTPVCVLNCDSGAYNLNQIPDDGCEFVLDTDAIYVSALDGDDLDPNCGLGPVAIGQKPCKTIAHGISRAQAVVPARTKVYVANGTYEETVELKNGISLLGGYRPDTWSRPTDLRTTMTIVRGNDTMHEPHKVTIYASGITTATVVEGFVIYGQSATGASGNSYAVYVTGSNGQLAIRYNVIYGASGGPGANAGQATAGAAGGAGGGRPADGTGYDPFEGNGRGSGCTTSRQNENGGSSTCSVAGGRGGGNYCYPTQDTRGSSRSGSTGVGTSGGAGGTGGYDGQVTYVDYNDPYFKDCNVAGMPGTMNGTDGGNGSVGTNGALGAGCANTTGTVSGGHWLGGTAAAGVSGAAGSGGGGGASGGGGDSDSGLGVNDVLGAHGGGGGAGGCGGAGGTGGAAGGSSFAIFINGSVAAININNNLITRGTGGAGGAGGGGGSGGEGGKGGEGGRTKNTPPLNCGGQGGKGGNGGNGGNGGGGGGGCGGNAIGIGYSGTAPTRSDNAFSGGTFGTGGAGGPSMGTPGTAGTNGTVANAVAY